LFVQLPFYPCPFYARYLYWVKLTEFIITACKK
jgi:hypothetical protein